MRKHAFDVTAFVWGALFLLLAGAVALDEVGTLTMDVRWLLPAGLVVLGIAGLAGLLRDNGTSNR